MLKYVLVACLFVGACQGRVPRFAKKIFPTGKITGGIETTIEKYPHQVQVVWVDMSICGGSIYSPSWVISSAGCVYRTEITSLNIRAGTSYFETGGILYDVAEYILHPLFDYFTIDYDVSVIKVTTPFTLGPTMATIPLTTLRPDTGLATVTGWGTKYSGGSEQPVLNVVDVVFVDPELCNSLYAEYDGITDRMLCAGTVNYGFCLSDSGAPLIQNGELVGTASWSVNCGKQGYPGVYTNIANEELRNFIVENAV